MLWQPQLQKGPRLGVILPAGLYTHFLSLTCLGGCSLLGMHPRTMGLAMLGPGVCVGSRACGTHMWSSYSGPEPIDQGLSKFLTVVVFLSL